MGVQSNSSYALWVTYWSVQEMDLTGNIGNIFNPLRKCYYIIIWLTGGDVSPQLTFVTFQEQLPASRLGRCHALGLESNPPNALRKHFSPYWRAFGQLVHSPFPFETLGIHDHSSDFSEMLNREEKEQIHKPVPGGRDKHGSQQHPRGPSLWDDGNQPMKANPTTAPIIPSVKDNWEVSQDGGWLLKGQPKLWIAILDPYSPSAASVCPPRL